MTESWTEMWVKDFSFWKEPLHCKISLNWEKLRVLDEFRYFGVMIIKDGSGKASQE